MEDESYRNMVLSKLNKNFNRKPTPTDKVDDVVTIECIFVLLIKNTIISIVNVLKNICSS